MPNDDLNLNQLDKELRIFIQHNVYLGIVFEALTSVPIDAKKLNFQPFRPTDRPTDPPTSGQTSSKGTFTFNNTSCMVTLRGDVKKSGSFGFWCGLSRTTTFGKLTTFCFCFHSIQKTPKCVKTHTKNFIICVFCLYLGVLKDFLYKHSIIFQG